MKIGNKEIVFNKYTRGIDRDYQIKLMKDLKIKTPELDVDGNVIPEKEYEAKFLENMQLANDFLVNKMTGLTQEEINDLSLEEYNNIISEITIIKENKTPPVA